MFTQLILTFALLSGLMIAWYVLQRLQHADDDDSECDYMEGRWGCGDCALNESCTLSKKQVQSPTP